MRLIDADEIIKKTYGVVIEDMFHMDETVDVISRKDIDNAPTIEAIPIEWIRHYKSIYGLTYSTLTNLLGTMIKDWEKESEQNKESNSQAD